MFKQKTYETASYLSFILQLFLDLFPLINT